MNNMIRALESLELACCGVDDTTLKIDYVARILQYSTIDKRLMHKARDDDK